jgi:chaperonin GroES
METALNLTQEPDTQEDNTKPLTFGDIFAPGVNLADFLSESKLNEIGQMVTRDVALDEASREEWCRRYDRWLDVAMQVRKAKNYPWQGASNVKYPLLTVSSLQFQARAYPAIVDGSNLVKGRVLGPDPDGQKRARADRIGQHMSWQLLYRMTGWEEDTDRLLLMLPIIGVLFRKTFYDSIANANRSEMITGKDFVIDYWAKSLETAPRYTHVLHYYPYEVQEKVKAKLWRDIRVQAEAEAANDDDAIVDFYEQHRCLDLDDDGYPEHYVVTTNKDGQVARIVPCFGAEDVTVMSDKLPKPAKLSDLLDESGKLPDIPFDIVRIERRQYFTKYGFLPAPDGSFYDIGYGSLLEDPSSAIDSLINQMVDAATLQNAGGGFLGEGVKIMGGDKPFRVGEWKRTQTGGGLLKDNIMSLPAAGPSSVSFTLLELLISAAKEITASADALTGTSSGTEQPTTLLARIEQAQKIITGILKRIHRSFGQELRILRRLNRDYLDEEEYFQLSDPEPVTGPDGNPLMGHNGGPVMTDTASIGRKDYGDKDLDVVPVSDPTTFSDMQKLARSDAEWQTFNGDPLVNQLELRRRRMEALGIRDIKKMLDVPPPAPDPEIMLKAKEADTRHALAIAQVHTARANASKAYADAALALNSAGLVTDAATLAAHAVEESQEEDNGEPGPQPAAGGGDVPTMEGAPADAGIPPVPPGPPIGANGGMGTGAMPDAGGTGAGGPAGPAGGDQF